MLVKRTTSCLYVDCPNIHGSLWRTWPQQLSNQSLYSMSEQAVLVLVAILVGAAATALTIKLVVNIRKKNDSNKVNQSNNKVGGDQAGRDIRK